MVTHTVHRKDEHKRGDSNAGICKWKEWRINVYLGRVSGQRDFETSLSAHTCLALHIHWEWFLLMIAWILSPDGEEHLNEVEWPGKSFDKAHMLWNKRAAERD